VTSSGSGLGIEKEITETWNPRRPGTGGDCDPDTDFDLDALLLYPAGTLLIVRCAFPDLRGTPCIREF